MQALKAFFSAPVFPQEEITRQAGLLSFLVNLHIIVAFSTALMLILFTDMPLIYPAAAFVSGLPGLALRPLMRSGRVTLASILFVSMIFAIMPTISWFSGNSVASVSVTLFQVLTIVMAGLLLGGRGAAAFVLLTGLANGALIFAELKGIYQVDTSRDALSILVMQVIVFSAISAMLYVTNRLIRESFARARRENEERRAAEAEIRKLNQELEHRVHERTAALEEAIKELETFSYSVSHDLRAPLRAMNGYIGILRNDFRVSIPPDAQDYLVKIQSSSTKMVQLIDELLSFSRLGRSELGKQDVDLNETVRTVIESLAPETDHRQIDWLLADLPPAKADPTLVHQVFANLIGNAVKYSRGRSPAHIEVGFMQQNAEIIYFVRDNGAGFDMKYADKLFGVFQRLHGESEFEGTGIGLATVQRIIHRHGGRIWAEAEVDKGATFYFTLG